MKVGVPKEIKNHEYRVGLTPASVRELTLHGHDVYVQSTAGAGIGVSDERYEQVGATILPTAEEVFDTAEMIVKVKEPQAVERAMLREDHVLFTYLHLAPDAPQTEDLVNSGACCIAYETVTDRRGHLPLLSPMSEVAGRLSIQAGAWCLEKAHGGLGVLLGGWPGVEPAKVVIIGGGTVGFNAAQMAIGLGARVMVMDRDADVMRFLDATFESRIETVFSNAESIERHIQDADLVVGRLDSGGERATASSTRLDMSGRFSPDGKRILFISDRGGGRELADGLSRRQPGRPLDNQQAIGGEPAEITREGLDGEIEIEVDRVQPGVRPCPSKLHQLA